MLDDNTDNLLEIVRKRQERLTALREEVARMERELADTAAMLLKSVKADPRTPVKPKSRHGFTGGIRQRPIQANSSIDWTRRVLERAGQPTHIDRIISLIRDSGGPIVKKPTLVSNLSRYTKHGDTFVRTGVSTYGLTKWNRMEMESEG